MRTEIDTLQVAVASNDILSNKHQQSYAGRISYFNSNTNSSTIYPIRHTIIVPTRLDPTPVKQKFQQDTKSQVSGLLSSRGYQEWSQ